MEARNLLGYFVWKITILRQKIIFFTILGGGRTGYAPPPGSAPEYNRGVMFVYLIFWVFGRQIYYWRKKYLQCRWRRKENKILPSFLAYGKQNLTRQVYVIWMWIDWYRKYQPAKPEYEVWWRVNEANESQTSYCVEQADIFQYQSYSHSDDMCIILKSNINTDTSIFVFSREKSHDSKYSKYASPKHRS